MINIEYFQDRTEIDEKGCWNWQLTTDTHGYGSCSLNIGEGKKSYGTHRLIYKILNGDLRSDQYVCHKCDNRKCCNPEHLFIGSHKENMVDMKNKKRGNNGDQIGNTNAVKNYIKIGRKIFSGYEAAGRHLGLSATAIRKRMKTGKYNYYIV